MRHDEKTKRLKKQADKLFSELVRRRGRCQRCGKAPPDVVLHCAHVYSRTYTAIRWDERNALCLCAGCHLWGHRRPVEWTLFIEDVLGAEVVRSLLEEAQSYVGRVRRVDYEEIVTDLKRKLAA